MKCKRCNREGATRQRLALFDDLDEGEDGVEVYGATAAICPACVEYIGEEIARLMWAAEILPSTSEVARG